MYLRKIYTCVRGDEKILTDPRFEPTMYWMVAEYVYHLSTLIVVCGYVLRASTLNGV